MQQSACQIMANVFWNVHGIIHNSYIEKRKTITAQYHSELLDRFDATIKTKRPHLVRRKFSFTEIMHRHTKQLKR